MKNVNPVPPEIAGLLKALGTAIPENFEAEFRKVESEFPFVRYGNGVIEYSSVSAAARGIGGLLAGNSGAEKCVFKEFALMLDLSRNAVPSIPGIKEHLKKFALAGYNQVMLYTEDIYRIDGVPEFGAWRGAYSAAEIREIDDFAYACGIELIPCIQTLGHLGHLLKWYSAFCKYADTVEVMEVGKPEVYEFIAKMLDFWKDNVRSRKIHLGMDETHGLGGGHYYAQHGPRDRFEIFNEHLGKVNAMCIERGLEPMIWGDMFFRIGSKTGSYGDLGTQFPKYATDAYPSNMRIVAWNYYNYEEDYYRNFLTLHRNFHAEPIMATGIYNSRILWSNHRQTRRTITPAIAACKKEKIHSMIVTVWNDDGSVSPPESKWPGVFGSAELAWDAGEFDGIAVRKRVEKCCNTDMERSYKAMLIEPYITGNKGAEEHLYSMLLHWDDPLLAMTFHSYEAVVDDCGKKLQKYYHDLAESLADKEDHIFLLAKVLAKKMELHNRLIPAYLQRNDAELADIAEKLLPELIVLNEKLSETFRTMWLDNYKAFGVESLQIRQAGQIARLHESVRQIRELLAGTREKIEELDVIPEKFAGYPFRYAYVATSGIL